MHPPHAKSASNSRTARTRRFARDESGAALVEFALVLPLMLIMFAVIVEGGRMMKNYQGANAGVRDAARYLARAVASNACSGGATSATGNALGAYTTKLEQIVRDSAGTGGGTVFGSGVTVDSVVGTFNCVAGTYRVSPAPVAQVTATITITFPFGGIFELAGDGLTQVTTTVTDQSRIFGT